MGQGRPRSGLRTEEACKTALQGRSIGLRQGSRPEADAGMAGVEASARSDWQKGRGIL